MFEKIIKAKRLSEAYRRFFTTEDGKIILEDLQNRVGITKSFESPDATTALVMERLRNFVFGIMGRASVHQANLVDQLYKKAQDAAKEFPEVPSRSPVPGTGMTNQPDGSILLNTNPSVDPTDTIE